MRIVRGLMVAVVACASVAPAVVAQDRTAVTINDTGVRPEKALEGFAWSAPGLNIEQEIIDLSRAKWQWMAEQNVDTLATLFHDQARFVHMSGSWGTEREIEIIRSGSIHYKQADIHQVVVEVIDDDTAILWNRITLLAEVRGAEVSNEFTVTEVYRRQGGGWKLLAMSFSSVRPDHAIEP